MVHEVALLGQPHEFPYNSKRDKMKIRLYYIRVPARYRPLCEDNNTYYYHTEAFVRRHARGGKIYLGVVDIAHSGGVLLCKNIVIPAVVLRNKFCEPSIMCEEKNTTWCKLKQKTLLFFVTTHVILLTFCCRWDELGFQQPERLIIQPKDARFPLPNTATIEYSSRSTIFFSISSPHKNLTAKNVVII